MLRFGGRKKLAAQRRAAEQTRQIDRSSRRGKREREREREKCNSKGEKEEEREEAMWPRGEGGGL
ncbi:hypothetical protein LZ31DRAFT_549768, partial [Colletotrichum somersetense]